MRPGRWRAFLAVLPLALILAVGGLLERSRLEQSKPRPLPGWSILRPPGDVSALAIQGETVWAGGKEGVFAIPRAGRGPVRRLACEQPLASVQALLVDPEGALWIGHATGLTRWTPEGWHTFTPGEGLPGGEVLALLRDQEGGIWAGTRAGAAVWEGDSWRVLTTADGLADDMVNVLLQDRQGGMWFGSSSAPRGGLTRLEGGRVWIFSTANGLPHNNVTALVEDREGTVWAGTGLLDRGGAASIARKDGEWVIERVLTRRDGLAGEKVRSLFQDQSGVFWLGSEYDGLTRWENGRMRVFSVPEGLSNPEVKAIAQDRDGNVWLGTRDGVTRIGAGGLRWLREDGETTPRK
ncbi:transcriptional regulator [bacterium CPR1]|nr:transcriptional regulator [bacterium CPR1]